MNLLQRLVGYVDTLPSPPRIAPSMSPSLLPGESPPYTTEVGTRSTPEDMLKTLYNQLEPNFDLRNTILEIRDMDRRDGRVKKIHQRTAAAAAKDGLMLKIAPTETRILGLWKEFERRLNLNRREKVESDLRGLLIEGNLPVQWVLDLDQKTVARGVRMPTETFKPVVDATGQFENVLSAYIQWDWTRGVEITRFPLWQLNMIRLRPDNYDDWSCFGRPYLDASRSTWRQLVMTERDLVVRRHTRAPQRNVHILEGATKADLRAYENETKNKQGSVTTDFYLNRKGGVTSIAGDANLDQIADVSYLLDTFFAGAPAPKGLFGYVGDLARDVLDDLKQDYFDELDALQDTSSFAYEMGFRLDLLLHDINPDSVELEVQFAQRRTDTPNQRADLGLKMQALGVPQQMVHAAAGLDPAEVKKYQDVQNENSDPYPPGPPAAPTPRVAITPGNARKRESATTISNS